METTTNKPRWAAYVRVSTATQVRAETHEAQREALTAWAESQGVDLEWYVDAGLSGMINQDGENFKRMMADLVEKNLVGIVATKLDRLGRDARGLIDLLPRMTAIHKELMLLDGGNKRTEQPKTAMDRFVWYIESGIAELNRAQPIERMAAGRARYIARGGKLGRHPLLVDWNDPTTKTLLKVGAGPTLLARSAVVRDRATGNIIQRGISYRAMKRALARREAEAAK